MEKDYDDLMRSIQPYCVGFAAQNGKLWLPVGSGTLIRFGKVKGILTCAHVLEEILKRKQIGFVLFPSRQEVMQGSQISVELLDYIKIGDKWGEDGPDLAFIRLPELKAGALGAKASFLNGLKQLESYINRIKADASSVILLSGLIGEWTETPKPHPTADLTLFQSVIVPCNVVSTNLETVFDTFHLSPVRDDKKDKHISSYGGASGGGAWRVYIDEDDTKIPATKTPEFVGISFYETKDGHIICHGRKSIFEGLYAQIKEKWGNDSV